MNGNGGCCIARWTDGGHVEAGYDTTEMDVIMMKYRPIAPKPVSQNGAVRAMSDSSNNSPRGSHHAKAATKERRKRCNSKKRKSSSPDNQTADNVYNLDHHEDQRGGVTLLPLFPEAPDLSPTNQGNNMPIWLNFDNYNNNIPVLEDNYRNCHGEGW